MPTFRQIVLKKIRKMRKVKWKLYRLGACPQKSSICEKVTERTPKKPCSARRTVAKVRLSNGNRVYCQLHGQYKKITKVTAFAKLLIRGGRPADLPAVRYRAIRGGKYNFPALYIRKTSRSVFGLKNEKRHKSIRQARKSLLIFSVNR